MRKLIQSYVDPKRTVNNSASHKNNTRAAFFKDIYTHFCIFRERKSFFCIFLEAISANIQNNLHKMNHFLQQKLQKSIGPKILALRAQITRKII